MKKKFAKFVIALLAVIFITAPLSCVFALSDPQVKSDTAILYNIKYDRILYEKNAEKTIFPASFTKLMTALLGFEYYKENPGKTVTVTDEAISSVGGTTMGLKSGEEISFEALLQGLVIANANDAALVIASTVSDSIPAFVDKMNQRAQEIGMTDTYYGNPTGIDSAVMHSTVNDTLKLCRTIYKINDFMVMSSLDTASVTQTNKSKARTLYNKNLLIPYSYVYDYYLKGCMGMIAGYTSEAGYCVASCFEGDDGVMIAVVSGGKDESEKQNGGSVTSYYDVKKLFGWGDSEFDNVTIAKKDDIICERKVLLGKGLDHVILAVEKDVNILAEAYVAKNTDKIKKKISADFDTLTAPVIKGEKYGEIIFIYNGKEIASTALVALTGVNRSTALTVFSTVKSFFSKGAPLVVLISLGAGFLIYILVLIIIVAVNSARKNREKRIRNAMLNAQENERLKIVAANEKVLRKKRNRKILRYVVETIDAITGEDERAAYVGKVPEKYRKTQRTSGDTRTSGSVKKPTATHRSTSNRPKSAKTQASDAKRRK